MGMSSSQPQPITQGTMGGGMGPSINNMGGGMGPSINNRAVPMGPSINNRAVPMGPQAQPIPLTQNFPQSSVPPSEWTATHSGPQGGTAAHSGFMPMGNAGQDAKMLNADFMPMGNHNFMPTGFGQMPQQPQMPTFGGPRGGKAPQ